MRSLILLVILSLHLGVRMRGRGIHLPLPYIAEESRALDGYKFKTDGFAPLVFTINPIDGYGND